MTITLDGSKGTTTPGLYSNATFTGTYSDGLVLDYLSGTGRISVGTNDGISFYNGGVGGTYLAGLDANGNFGLGVTPSGWGAGYRAFDIGTSSLMDTGSMNLMQNLYPQSEVYCCSTIHLQ